MYSPFPYHYNKGTFKFQIVTTEENEQFTLPIEYGEGYNFDFVVNWGDTSSNHITDYEDENITHEYAVAGTYDIELIGVCEFFDFDASGTPSLVTKLLSFTGDMGFKVLRFQGCENLIEVCSLGRMGSLKSMDNLFSGCTALTAIPSNLFVNITEVTDCTMLFLNCSTLTAIPSGLFDTLTKVTTFQEVFNGCSLIESIPANLFKYNTEVETFSSAFFNCIALETIPTDLFKYTTKVTNFENLFLNCVITSIPAGLFNYTPDVVFFSGVFQGCPITSIPSGLFNNNLAVEVFDYAFYGCTVLTGNAPALWLRDPAPTGISCFNGAIGLDNYGDIPVGWK